jgi:hypothetical protein
MPVKLYHFGEKCEVWMLTEEEFEKLPPQQSTIEEIKAYRDEHDVSLKEAFISMPSDAVDIYQEITGERVKDPNFIYRRRRSLFGPICPNCGKPFRTPKASKCVEKGCGSI